MTVLGVSNKVGITVTDHKKSKDLSNYHFIEEGDFAYNPYRINVGSIGLVPRGISGLVSPAYVVFKTNNSLISELLFDFLKSNDGLFQINKFARGTVRKALRFEDLCQIEMPVPSIDIQQSILKKKESVEIEADELKDELTHQQTLLKKLRQQILQEAIEGKLTADWRAQNPDVEPASELLARIQAEKQQLIKDKKIKKQKPLPAISEEEKPFALPKGWVWCRFGDVLGSTFYGPRFGKGEYVNNGIPTIRTTDMDNGVISFKSPPMVNVTDSNKIDLYKLKYDDLLITRTGSIGTMALYKSGKLAFPSAYLIRCRFQLVEMAEFLFNYLMTPMIQDYFGLNTKTGTRPNINAVSISNSLLPLPPLPEQKAIVAKVEKLLALCDQLETQITHNQNHANALMQAVLKEAFTQTTEQTKPVAANA